TGRPQRASNASLGFGPSVTRRYARWSSAGAGVEAAIAASLEEPEGKRKVRILFAEVDSLYIPLQRGAKRHVEEKVITLHEGWTPRYPGSSEYRLVEPKQFRTVASDFWEAASRFAYSHYDIDEHTI